MGKRGPKAQQRDRIDLGTPELRAKREAAIGPRRDKWPEPSISEGSYLLGALLWRGHLDAKYDQARKMHDAGIQFAGWWVLTHPKSFGTGTLSQFVPGQTSELTDAEAERIRYEAEHNLANASMDLKKERAVYDAIVNVCIYQRFQPANLDKLRVGLHRLIERQKEMQKAA